jgi:hypothetical protein
MIAMRDSSTARMLLAVTGSRGSPRDR